MGQGVFGLLVVGVKGTWLLRVLKADRLRCSDANVGLVLRLECREHFDTIAQLDGKGRCLLLHVNLKVLRLDDLTLADELVDLELDALAATEHEVLELADDLDGDLLAVEEVDCGASVNLTLAKLNDLLDVLVVEDFDGIALLDFLRLLNGRLRLGSRGSGSLCGRSGNRSGC